MAFAYIASLAQRYHRVVGVRLFTAGALAGTASGCAYGWDAASRQPTHLRGVDEFAYVLSNHVVAAAALAYTSPVSLPALAALHAFGVHVTMGRRNQQQQNV